MKWLVLLLLCGCQSAAKLLPDYAEVAALDTEREAFKDGPIYEARLGWHLTPREVVIAGQGDHPWTPSWLGWASEPPSLEDTPPLVVVDPVAQEALEALREALVGLQEAMAQSAAASERTARVLEDAEKTIAGLNRAANGGYGLIALVATIFGGRAAKRRWFPNHDSPSK